MNRRQVLLPAGLAAAAAGAVFTLRPSLVPAGVVPTLAVLGVWAVAMAGAGVAVLSRLADDGPSDGRLPTVSDRPAYPVPGDALATRTRSVGASERDAAERDAIRDRLRRAAVTVLVRREGIDRETARQRVAEGSWTSDGEAAALFADEGVHDHVEAAFARRVERAADAVHGLFDRGGDG